MSGYQHVSVEVSSRIATVTIRRAIDRNTMSAATAKEFSEALDALSANDEARVMIVTAEGSRVFCAGAELTEMMEWRRDDGLRASAARLYSAIERFRRPTIAAINGAAVGGGCELALACDFRIAAEHAYFRLPEVALGVIPAAGATHRLPQIIGLGRAKEMIFTGDRVDATTALAWGLVSKVVPGDELPTAARSLASRLLRSSPTALQMAKVLFGASPGAAGVAEAVAQALCFESADKAEGVHAFLEKREPRFR